MPKFLTQDEVMTLLKCSRKTLYTYRKEFGLPTYSINGKVLIDEKELLTWIQKHKEVQGAK